MALQQEILNLLLKLKDKNLSSKEKSKIKAQLKKLYSKIKRISSKQIKITSPFKEEVKQALFPLQQSLITEKQKLKLFENTVKNEIKQLEEQRALAVDPNELKQLSLMIKEKKEEIQLLKSNIKEGAPIGEAIQSVIEARNVNTPEEAKIYALNMIRQKILNNKSNLSEKDLITEAKKPIGRILKRVLGNITEKKYKEELEKLVVSGFEKVKALLEAEAEQLKQQQAEEALRKAQEAEIRKQEEALRKLQRQAQEAERRQAEEDKRQRLEYKSARSPKKPSGIRQGFLTTPESHYGFDTPIPAIIADFINYQKKAEFDKTIPMREFNDFKARMALDISQMTPEEQSAIRFYTVSRQDKDLEKILKASQDIVSQSGLLEDPEEFKQTLNRLETRDDKGQFIDWTKLKGQGKKNSKYNYMGKKKVRGGAGIADWALTLGSIPGIPQLMNNFGPFGQVLGNASGLAQTFGKTAGQLAKEASKEGEKVAGFTDSLGGIKSMFGFGKKRGRGKANMADMSGGAFSDFLGTIGAITPKIGGIVGAIPTYGKVATIGNSVLGSASRVGEDIFKMLGLGNMDTTLSGFGNMDLSNQKGYGKKKKGGRKMLPLDRPMPRDMAYILPYGLQAEPPHLLNGGAYGLTDIILDSTGDLIKAGVKGLANSGVSLVKDLAKSGVQQLANKAVQSIGKGKKKKCGDCMRGKGKINGEYVSSEFEDEYLNNLAHVLNQKQMAQLQGERQLEQQIQHQMNIEQQNALAQLQYYDLLNKVQQPRPQF